MRARVSGVPSRFARIVFVACAVISFGLPYFVVSAVSAHRDRQWQGSGLSVYEIEEWRENGFTDPIDAIQWRNARFHAPGAHIWRDEGWRDGAEAARWRDAGFGAHEARRLSRSGMTAAEAASAEGRRK